jgi:uncharacterized membrane protein (UPF0127 family)
MILPIIVRRCLPMPVPERPFARKQVVRPEIEGDGGERRMAPLPWHGVTASRLRELPRRRVCGRPVPVALGFRSRLLGLAGLDLAEAGPGLLIPRCASVHTFGMRFALDLVFLDGDDCLLSARARVPPRRFAWHRGAASVLEIPSAQGGEFAASTT